jgi:hypothetical protein
MTPGRSHNDTWQVAKCHLAGCTTEQLSDLSRTNVRPIQCQVKPSWCSRTLSRWTKLVFQGIVRLHQGGVPGHCQVVLGHRQDAPGQCQVAPRCAIRIIMRINRGHGREDEIWSGSTDGTGQENPTMLSAWDAVSIATIGARWPGPCVSRYLVGTCIWAFGTWPSEVSNTNEYGPTSY